MVEIDYEAYSSLEELAAASTDVLIALPGDLVAREGDRGSKPPVDLSIGAEDAGIPMVFREAKVTKVFAGTSGEDGEIVVGELDMEGASSEAFEPLPVGRPTLLFLRCNAPGEWSGITVVDEFCVPTGGNAGVVEIEAGGYVARALETTTVGPEGPRGEFGAVELQPTEVDTFLESLE